MTKAIICDIDGTLADKGDRHPFDYKNVDKDTCKHAVAEVVRAMKQAGYAVVIFSGREDSCLDITWKWLSDNNIPKDGIYMRKTGDHRKDSIVKRELYESIKDIYDVQLVLDDRDQVVEMWRKELGLTCLQVDCSLRIPMKDKGGFMAKVSI